MEQIIKELVILGKKKDPKFKEVEDKDEGKVSIPNLISSEKEEEYDEMSAQNNNQVPLQEEIELGQTDDKNGVDIEMMDFDGDGINANNNLVSKMETKEPQPPPQQLFGSRMTLGPEIQKLGPPETLTAQNDGSILYKTASGQSVVIPGDVRVNIEPIPDCLVRMYLPKASLENHKAWTSWDPLQVDQRYVLKMKKIGPGWNSNASALQSQDNCLKGGEHDPLKLVNSAKTITKSHHPMLTRSQLQMMKKKKENDDDDAKKSKVVEDKGRKVPYQRPVVEKMGGLPTTFTEQPNGTILYKSNLGTWLLPEVQLNVTPLRDY